MSEKPQRQDWDPVRLGDVATLITKGTTPNHRGFEYKNNGITFLKVECISSSGRFVPSRFAYIDQLCHNSLRRSQLQQGDLLYSIAGALGRRAIVDVSILPANTNQALAIIRLGADAELDRQYLFHFLVSPQVHNQIARFAVQSAQANISLANVNDFVIDSPPIPEQRKIASILTTVDSLIEQTEALIEKYRRVKQGMMADLLSRGVDSSGKLRPTQKQAPQLYKQSELGWIPKEWEVEKLDDVAQRGSGHTPDRKVAAYWNGGVKWVSLADSSSLDQLFISETENNISDLGLANSSAVKHPSGTVILSRDAGIGKSAILGDVMAVSQHFMAWRAGDNMNHFFLYYWMQHGKPRFEAIAMGSTIKTIGLSFFRRLTIALPPKTEQDFAAEILTTLDNRLFGLEDNLAKLRTLKTGLMQDLLTGKVRVTVDQDEGTAAHA